VRGYAKEVKELYQSKVDAARAKPSADSTGSSHPRRRGSGGAENSYSASSSSTMALTSIAPGKGARSIEAAASMGASEYPPIPPHQGGSFASFAQAHRAPLQPVAGAGGGGGVSSTGNAGGGGPAGSAEVLALGHVSNWDVAGVGCWLGALGLGEQYGETFATNEINGAVLLEASLMRVWPIFHPWTVSFFYMNTSSLAWLRFWTYPHFFLVVVPPCNCSCPRHLQPLNP